MEILDKKSNRMSRANAGVFECNEFPDFLEALSNLLLRASYDALDFLLLRNLLSNKLFFTFCEFTTTPFYSTKIFSQEILLSYF